MALVLRRVSDRNGRLWAPLGLHDIKRPGHEAPAESHRRKRQRGCTTDTALHSSKNSAVAAMMKWNAQADDLLRQLCADDSLSYGDIARILTARWHRPISRSAVGQRSRRCGFRETTSRQYTIGTERPVVPQSPTPPPAPAELPRFARRLDFPDPEPHAPGILILNASENDCRFPVHGKGTSLRVCGEPRVIGSYCEHCAKRAFTGNNHHGRGGFTLKSASEARAWREKNTPVARLALAV